MTICTFTRPNLKQRNSTVDKFWKPEIKFSFASPKPPSHSINWSPTNTCKENLITYLLSFVMFSTFKFQIHIVILPKESKFIKMCDY